MSTIEVLRIQNNRIIGTIPPSWSRLGALGATRGAGLQMLDVSSNSLEGTLPPQLGKISSFVFLSLRNNR